MCTVFQVGESPRNRKTFYADNNSLFPFREVTDASHLFFTRNENHFGYHQGQWMLGKLGFNNSGKVEFRVDLKSKDHADVKKRLSHPATLVLNGQIICKLKRGVSVRDME